MGNKMKGRRIAALLLAVSMVISNVQTGMFAIAGETEQAAEVQNNAETTDQETAAEKEQQEAAQAQAAAQAAEQAQDAEAEAAARKAEAEAAAAQAAAEAAKKQAQAAQSAADQQSDGNGSAPDGSSTDATDPACPAFSFSDVKLKDGAALDISVPDGALPVGTDLAAKVIDFGGGYADPAFAQSVLEKLSAAAGLPGGQLLDAAQVKAYHIFFYDDTVGETPHIQPKKEVSFTLRSVAVQGDSQAVYAVSDEGTGAVKLGPEHAEVSGNESVTANVKNVKSFGVFAVVGTTKQDSADNADNVDDAQDEQDQNDESAQDQSSTENLPDDGIRRNLVTFRCAEGTSVFCKGEDVTNGTAYAEDGRIVFTIELAQGCTLDSVLVDETIPARKTVNENGEPSEKEYIIEGIQTNETTVDVAATVTEVVEEQPEETEAETEIEETEAETETIMYPAFSLEDVSVEGTDVTLSVDAPEGAFPAGIQMRAQLKETPEEVLEAANAELAYDARQESVGDEAADGEQGKDVTGAKVTAENAVTFNIAFYLPEDPETEIEPRIPISVTFSNVSLEGDVLQVYHTEDSSEGGKEAEKVMDSVENTEVLTVNGLSRFSDYTVLAMPLRAAGDEDSFISKITNNKDGSTYDLTEEGTVITSAESGMVLTLTIRATFPSNSTDRQIKINAGYGLGWRSSYNNLNKESLWYTGLQPNGMIAPGSQAAAEDKSIKLGSYDLGTGTLTLKYKDTTEEVEIIDSLDKKLTLSSYYNGTNGFSVSIPKVNKEITGTDPITVTFSYKSADGVQQTVTRKLTEINFTDNAHSNITSGATKGTQALVENGIYILKKDGTLRTTDVAWHHASSGPKYWATSQSYFVMEIPRYTVMRDGSGYDGPKWNGTSPGWLGTDYTTTIVEDGAELPDGSILKLVDPDNNYAKLYIFGPGPQGITWTYGGIGSNKNGIHYNVKFPQDDYPISDKIYTMRLAALAVKPNYGDWISIADNPNATYAEIRIMIKDPEEDVYVNVGATSTAHYGTATNGDVYPSNEDVDHMIETGGGLWRLGNRGTGDSVPKTVTHEFGTTNGQYTGITYTGIYSSYMDRTAEPEVDPDLKVWVWKPGTEDIQEVELSDSQKASIISKGLVHLLDLGVADGYYIKKIQYNIKTIPARTTATGTTDKSYGGVELVRPGSDVRAKDTLTVCDMEDPDNRKYVGVNNFTAHSKMQYWPYSITVQPTSAFTSGSKANLTFNVGAYGTRGENQAVLTEKIYLISPYGEEYENIKVSYIDSKARAATGRTTSVSPVITEITDESRLSALRATAGHENARVWELDFTGMTEYPDKYNRLSGNTDSSAASLSAYPYSGKVYQDKGQSPQIIIKTSMQLNMEDPLGSSTTGIGGLVWAKVTFPKNANGDDDLSGVTINNGVYGWNYNYLDDTFNLTGHKAKLIRGASFTIAGASRLIADNQIKEANEEDSSYRQYEEGNEESLAKQPLYSTDYRIETVNSSTQAASLGIVYFPIPKKGQAWSGEIINLTPNGPFTYNVNLTGPGQIETGDGYSILYARNASPNADSETWDSYEWSDGTGFTEEDWKAVNFVKISKDEIQPLDHAEFKFSLEAEANEAEISEELVNVWQPCTYTITSEGTTWKEENSVGTRLCPGTVKGIVWYDADKDGILDEDEERAEGVTLELFASDGTTPAGSERTVTDENGEYVLDVYNYEAGQIIRITNPDETKYAITVKENDSVFTTDAGEYVLDEFTTYEKTDIDCGFVPYIDIPVTKIWDDGDNQDGFRPENITVKLTGTTAAAESSDSADAGDGTSEEDPADETAVVEIEQELTAEHADPEDESGNTWIYTFKGEELGLTEYDHGQKITYSIDEEKTDVLNGEDAPGTYAVSVEGDEADGFTITNTHTPEINDIVVTKIWDDEENAAGLRPDEITVHLYADDEEAGDRVITEDTETGDWSCTYKDLPKYKEGKEINYTLTEDEIENYTTQIENTDDGFEVTNSFIQVYVDATVTKVWDDADDQDGIRPGAVYVKLLANGQPYEGGLAVLDASNDWTGTIKDLPVYAAGGKVKYTFTENTVRGYTTDIGETEELTEVSEDGTEKIAGYQVTITNTHVPETVDIPVQKLWDDADDQDGARPESVVFRLLADGHAVKLAAKDEEEADVAAADASSGGAQDADWDPAYKAVLTAENQEEDNPNIWTYVFTGMPKYDHGHAIQYSVVEDVPEDYSFDIEGNGIINTYTPGQTSVTVTKAWDDSYNQDGRRPQEVVVDLLADDEVIETVTLTEGNGWTHTWQGLAVKKNDGESSKEIVYTVQEHDVDAGGQYGDTGYTLESIEETAEGSGSWIITNSYEPETTVINGLKIWEDDDDRDGVRPESVELVLYDGTEVIGVYTLTADGLSAGGAEADPPQDLRAADETAENTWFYTIDADGSGNPLPRYRNGQEISYTVLEMPVEGYAASYDGFFITNRYTPGKTSVTVTKAWDDGDDYEGLRPESVSVKISASVSGQAVDLGGRKDETITLDEAHKWTYTWTNLPQKSGGEDITYTVEEVPGEAQEYSAEVTGSHETGFIIANTYEVSCKKVTGKVIWDDLEDVDGIRPYAVTITLYADGVETASRTVQLPADAANAEEPWRFAFTGLPIYREGWGKDPSITSKEDAKIEYTVTQNAVYDYTTTIEKDSASSGEEMGASSDDVLLAAADDASGDDDSFTVTNVHRPERVTISGHKIWKDNSDQDGIRPDSITVYLYADGEYTAKTTVSASSSAAIAEAAGETADDDVWAYEFTDLKKYNSHGDTIRYTVSEKAVTNYTMRVSGYDITNTYTPDKTFVTVIKTWSDKNNAAGERPDSITVRLYADGKEIDRTSLSAGNGWFAIFSGLDAKKDGKAISYTVTEDAVKNYSSAVSGDATAGYTVTNTFTGTIPTEKEEKRSSEKSSKSSSTVSSSSTSSTSGGGTPGKSSVKTGDDTPLLPYLLAAFAALAVLALGGIVLLRKRRRIDS